MSWRDRSPVGPGGGSSRGRYNNGFWGSSSRGRGLSHDQNEGDVSAADELKNWRDNCQATRGGGHVSHSSTTHNAWRPSRSRGRGAPVVLGSQSGFLGRGRGHGGGGSRGFHTSSSTFGSRSSQVRTSKYPAFGFKKLYGFLHENEQTPDQVIFEIDNDLQGWKALIDTKLSDGGDNDRHDTLVLIIHVLGEKVVHPNSVLQQAKLNIITKTVGSAFCNAWSRKCEEMMMMSIEDEIREPTSENDLVVDQSRVRILRNLHNIFSFVVSNLKTTATDSLPRLLPGIIGVLHSSNASQQIQELIKDFQALKDKIFEMVKMKKEQHVVLQKSQRRGKFSEDDVKRFHSIAPPDDFRGLTIIPTVDELFSEEKSFIRPNLKHGAYQDANHYLDVQFRLLREDFIQPLKSGVQEFMRHSHEYLTRKKRMPFGNVRLYSDTRILNLQLFHDSVIYKMKLPERIHQRVQWHKSKRLLVGSLLVLTCDHFKSAYFAVVVGREVYDLKDDGVFYVTFEGEAPDLETREKNFVMLECEVYFEAYRHTLEALKKIPLEKFPMSKFIVSGNSSVDAPKYLRHAPEQLQIDGYQFSALQGPWPTPEQLGLDENQFSAFHAALTQEFAIIQGPPGTGKTFLGLKIAEVLLKNLQIWRMTEAKEKNENALFEKELSRMNEARAERIRRYHAIHGQGPILIVCYTNHALDQFLEGLVPIIEKTFTLPQSAMIRVGSRSKSEILKNYNLHSQRPLAKEMSLPDSPFERARKRADAEMDDCEYYRSQAMSEIMALTHPTGIIDFKTLSFDWFELEQEIPEEVWEIISNPAELGFLPKYFNNFENFQPSHLIRRWFQVKQSLGLPELSSTTSAAAAKNVKNKRQVEDDNENDDGGEGEGQQEQEKEEDYDMDELRLTRFVEDWCGADGGGCEWSPFDRQLRPIQYIQKFGLRDLQDQLTINDASIDDLVKATTGAEAHFPKTIEEKQKQQQMRAKILQLQCENTIIENQIEFLQKLFQMYKSDQLNLPNIDKLVKKSPSSDSDGENENDRKKLYSNLKYSQKWALYFHVLEKARLKLIEYAQVVQTQLIDAHKNRKDVQNYGDGLLLRGTKIVGMTTTGAAKHGALLRMMNSKIVIVEEAAEVLESHIVSCLTEHCEHLILIGDHKQLQPSTTVMDLATKYNMNISLFERMLNNHLSCHQLKIQHRMRPEICNLIHGTIYEQLENHESVLNYPEIRGCVKNLFFIAHQEPETAEDDSMSKENPHEAKFLARFTRYLIQQGYSPAQITILTTYTGQMFLLQKEIREFSTCGGVRITCVDNFQGEENDIILLSLVRSNPEDKIGFIKTDNRICVALSRAKHGLFIIGNMNLLKSKSDTWNSIHDKLAERAEVGESLELVCSAHGIRTLVINPDNFDAVPEGGCGSICTFALSCGHTCKDICHGKDQEHVAYKCMERCEKQCVGKLHQCGARCSRSPCPPCLVKMTKTLSCGQHTQELACHENEMEVECWVLVTKSLPCGHETDLPCYMDPVDYKCKKPTVKILPCDHEKTDECWKDPSEITCKVVVEKTLPSCGHTENAECHQHVDMIRCMNPKIKKFTDCGHELEVLCDQLKNETRNQLYCKAPCGDRLECGHACTKTCHVNEDPEHLEYFCRKPCSKRCENEHKCTKDHQCGETCDPCTIPIEKLMSCGIHTKMLKCHEDPAKLSCLEPCDRVLDGCGHKCTRKCNENCTPCLTVVGKISPCGHLNQIACGEVATREMCDHLVPPRVKPTCGHEILVPCKIPGSIRSNQLVKYCNQPCQYLFDEKDGGCGHRCRGTCSECQQGRLHLKCQEPCGRQLVCGHVCTSPCSEACPPCKQPCNMKCEHSICKKPCGQPCEPCNEKCQWKCKHLKCTKLCGEPCDRKPCNEPCDKKLECGHECIGFCGEPCPPLCRICDKEKLTEFTLLGNEDEPDSRFVYLEDCSHSIEREGLEYHLIKGIQSETGEIQAKCCPQCKTVIRRSRRYGNVIREAMEKVMEVKKKIYGIDKKNKIIHKKLQQDLYGEVTGNQCWIEEFPMIHEFVTNQLAVWKSGNSGGGGAGRRKHWKWKQIDGNKLKSIELLVKHARDVIKLLQEPGARPRSKLLEEALHNRLKKLYEHVFGQFIERIPLTQIEARDFDRKFQRLFDLRQFFLRKSVTKFRFDNTKAASPYLKALAIALSPKVYTEDMRMEVCQLLKEVDEHTKSGLGITDRERHEILSAIGLARGRWFQCPNGHIYVITECGGAMEEGKCNECGATIGGANHRLRSDNTIATEMDGATEPLYPGMLQR